MTDPIRIDTPESVDLALEPAGLGTRFAAAMIDAAIQGFAAWLLLVLLIGVAAGMTVSDMMLDELTEGVIYAILLLVFGLLFLLYKLLLEAFWNGQTVGKRIVGIRVIRSNGLPVQFLQVLIRNMMRPVDYLPGSYILGAITILATRRNQRVGDLVAGTVVIHDRKRASPLLPGKPLQPMEGDLSLLREHVLRLEEEDLEPLRTFWQRRFHLLPEHRLRVASLVTASLVTLMGWQEPLPLNPEEFLETILYLRSQ